MKIKFCTITGADDNTSVESLIGLSRAFPFVEWGILLGSHGGTQRFPSTKWIADLLRAADLRRSRELNLSAHLCGSVLDRVISPEWVPLADEFGRAQLNFHGVRNHVSPSRMKQLRTQRQQWLFQMDGINDDLFYLASPLGVNCVPIFDKSHGAGMLPDTWPAPIKDKLCTYAGGIGPENIKEQLAKLDGMIPGDTEICVDMETRVRSQKENSVRDQLDLDKVMTCLHACEKYVQ